MQTLYCVTDKDCVNTITLQHLNITILFPRIYIHASDDFHFLKIYLLFPPLSLSLFFSFLSYSVLSITWFFAISHLISLFSLLFPFTSSFPFIHLFRSLSFSLIPFHSLVFTFLSLTRSFQSPFLSSSLLLLPHSLLLSSHLFYYITICNSLLF